MYFQVKENERLKKQYQKDELKIKKLENEIINTKKQRVILAQKIAEKNEVHREESKKREKTMRQVKVLVYDCFRPVLSMNFIFCRWPRKH